MTTMGSHRRLPYLLFAAALSAGCLKENDEDSPGTAAYRWHTFYGSTLPDRAYQAVIDGNDNAYMVGRSQGTWTGPGGEAPLHAHTDPGDTHDLFVLKLAHDGSYLWHTFYGVSTGPDYALSVAVDGSGRVHVTGFSSATWDGPAGQHPLQAFAGGGKDVFVLKLTTDGAYNWHTFYGADSYEDEGAGIALDGNGNIYVAVKSYATWNGPGPTSPLHAYTGTADGDTNFNIAVLKLSNGGAYQWHTFLGAASVGVEPSAIAVDGDVVYAAGLSSGSWNGPAAEAPLHAHAGGDADAFVLKLDTDGAYQWHTFYGSASNDGAYGLATAGGRVYATGFGNATWNGPSAQVPHHAYSGGADLTLLALSDAGAYLWHTFYGSATADECGLGLAFDADARPYVAGRSHATWLGDDDTAPIDAYTGEADIVILKLDGAGDYCWHTFYGSTGDDWGQALALDGRARIRAVGYSSASWNGPSGQSPLRAYAGTTDLIEVVLENFD